MGKKRRPEFKISQWYSRTDRWSLFKKDRRATRSGGWRLVKVDAMLGDVVDALRGKR